jgi:Lectin C-type domain
MMMPLHKFVVLLLVTSTRYTKGQDEKKPDDVFQGHVYQVVNGSFVWGAANDDAQSRTRCSVRGHLATITSQDEQDFIASLIRDSMIVDEKNSVWIGLNDFRGEGPFEWITGEPFEYMNWDYLEPNNANKSEDCVQMFYAWNDVGCDARSIPYIVEFDCETSKEFAGHTYQIIGAENDWNSANDDARSRTECGVQGHLVAIGSQAEQDFVASLYQNIFALAQGAWIGLTDFQVEGMFQWVTGEPVTFDGWLSQQPDEFNRTEDCMALISPDSSVYTPAVLLKG